jgi:polyisoprenoid-binding protein YceI
MPLSGTYAVDPVHSSVRFRVHHGGIAFFRGYFEGFEGTLDASGSEPVLNGSTKVENISIRQPDFFRGHVMGEEFFDAEKYPDISFRSTAFKQDGGDVTIEGELTIRDATKPITATGTLVGPTETHAGTRLALDVETTIKRQDFGVSWEAPTLPSGGPSLADDVTLEFTLQLAAQDD